MKKNINLIEKTIDFKVINKIEFDFISFKIYYE
jgi:hypothetical protein